MSTVTASADQVRNASPLNTALNAGNSAQLMSRLFAARGDDPADDPFAEGVPASQRLVQIQMLAAELRDLGVHTLALLADNGPAWVLVDLACQLATIRLLPLPGFFTPQQMIHAMDDAACDALIADRKNQVRGGSVQEWRLITGGSFVSSLGLRVWQRAGDGQLPKAEVSTDQAGRLPAGTQKVTYTSGSTGTPKGVCLSLEQQLGTAQALFERIGLKAVRHLCILPLATLLENIAGVYAPLMSGGQVLLPSSAEVGIRGSSGLDVLRLCAAISSYKPHSMILLPQMLSALLLLMEKGPKHGWRPPRSLRFVAVGGARVSAEQIRRARELGLPVYEGYGLSECASVVSLNTPGNDQPGSAGQTLGHLSVAAVDGELHVLGNTFLGYVGEPRRESSTALPSGDLGYLDAQGFVHLEGRKHNRLISSYGRNISPEWPESELLGNPLILQAVVFGDARPWCVALLRVVSDAVGDQELEAWIREVNQRLPDYAQIGNWYRLPRPLSAEAGELTANGRPRREQVFDTWQDEICSMYEDINEIDRQVLAR